uniref:Polyprotein n=1 Tax=Electrophorus electricus TaxID=8005 RepID=A0AAY5F5W5_ELEEL
FKISLQNVWCKYGQDYHSVHTVLTVNHRAGSVMTLGCTSAIGVGEMTFIDGTMNTCGYTKILADKMTPGLQLLGRLGIF